MWYNNYMNGSYPKIISVTELRRRFGEVTENLVKTDELILTKGGEPFAILKAAPEEKRKLLRKVAGAWKNTPLDRDTLWKKVAKKKSRKSPIFL